MGLDEWDIDAESAWFFTSADGSVLKIHATFLSSLKNDIILVYILF